MKFSVYYKYLVIMSALSMSLVSCHPKKSSERKRQVLPFIPPSQNEANSPLAYQLSDPSCISGTTGLQKINSAQVFKHKGTSVEQELFQFETARSPVSLENAAIEGSVFNHGEVSECELINGEIKCNGEGRSTSEARALKVCDDKKNFPRNSYEGVGLSSLSGMERVASYYRDLPGHDRSLPRALMIVLPKIEQSVTYVNQAGQQKTRSVFMTDNMAYVPNLSGKPAFIVFPKGPFLAELGIWKNVNLWESDWVIAHEYGHHVFMHHTGARVFQQNTLNIHNVPTHAPLFPKHVQKNSGDKKELELVSRKSTAYGAVNEMFADLFAYFSISQRSELINGLDCFKQSRDPAFAKFATGRPKVLDREVLSIFSGESQPIAQSDLGCDQPDFTDVHSVGAIVSHAVYSVIKLSPSYQNLQSSDPKFGQLLVSWANQLKAEYGERVVLSPNFGSLLKPMFTLLASEQGGQLNANQCAAIKQLLPAVDPRTTAGICR